MKSKISLLFILFFSGLITLHAQIRKGSTSLGGEIGFSHYNDQNMPTSNSDQNANNGSISLSLGKAIEENSVIGFTLQFGASNNDYTNNGLGKSTLSEYGAGIFYRKYKELSKDFYFFYEGYLNYGHSESNYKDSIGNKINGSTNSAASLGIATGISYKLFKPLYVEVSLPPLLSVGYSVNKSSQQTVDNKRTSFNVSTGFNGSLLQNIAVGFRFIF